MSDPPQNRQASLPSRRIDLDREITIQVPAFDSFVTEYSANVSTTGMFIKSKKPLPPDTEISVEFRIADDWKLIRGEAQVVWCRYRDEGPGQPAGMGVHFTDLEPQSRRLISWIIEKHVRDGGKPFDLDELRGLHPEVLAETTLPETTAEPESSAPATPRPTAPRKSRAGSRSASVRGRVARQPVRFRLVPLLLAGVVVTAVLYGLFWLSERSAQSAANPELPAEASFDQASTEPAEEDERSADASDPPAAPASATPAAANTQPPAAAAPESRPATPVFLEVARRTVEGWAQAWSEQDVESYLAYYSRGFTPADGQSQSAWAANRRQRLSAPEFIRVSITALEAEAISDSRGRAEFTQSYRANTYADTVRKVIELVREDGRWKILEEKTVG